MSVFKKARDKKTDHIKNMNTDESLVHLKTLKERVRGMLELYERTRDDDILLYFMYLKTWHELDERIGVDTAARMLEIMYEGPMIESVRRIRQKIQEEGEFESRRKLQKLKAVYDDDEEDEEEKVTLWKVWSEGYKASGQDAPATFHGEFPGETFQDACKAYKATLTDQRSIDCVHVDDPNDLNIWGCRFFDNEADARKFNG